MILTTHAEDEPLLLAMERLGKTVVRVRSLQHALDYINSCEAYYGNVFTEIKKPLLLSRFVNLLGRNNVPYIFWNRDAPWNVGVKKYRIYLLKLLRPIDIYLAHSAQTAQFFSDNFHYFPNAARQEYLKDTNLAAMRNQAAYSYDVSFVGSLGDAKKFNSRFRVEFLAAVRAKLSTRINNLRFVVTDTSKESLSLSGLLNLIRSSKINLNVGAMCDLPGNQSWGLPERVFGIPAAGGFLLTDNRLSLSDTFNPESWDAFNDAEECSDKIISYLNNFEMLRSRAEQLHHQVYQSHTYEARAQKLFDLINEYKKFHALEPETYLI